MVTVAMSALFALIGTFLVLSSVASIQLDGKETLSLPKGMPPISQQQGDSDRVRKPSKTYPVPEMNYKKPVRTNPEDLAALKAFFISTNGVYWLNNSNWMKGDPCTGDWLGLYCDEDGYVLFIMLPYNNLTGEIPKDVLMAKRLERLTLYDNGITMIAPEVFQSSSLQYISVSHNRVTSLLPSTVSMASIQELDVSSNLIAGSIPTTWNTPELNSLDLSSNSFKGTPPAALGTLKHLQSIYLSFNSLSGTLPDSWGSLRFLKTLWIFNNNIRSVFPSSWGDLEAMTDFEADGMIGGLPDYIGKYWSNVSTIKVVRGELTGSIPLSFCNLKKLQVLWLFQNNLTGSIPYCIGQASLVELELSLNSLTGSIPSSIEYATQLKILFLDRNYLSGEIPRSIGNLQSLTNLRLSTNNISGSIPDVFQNMVNLTEIDLGNNELTGSIPRSFGYLTLLETMDLAQNRLIACVPNTMDRLLELAAFEIQFNMLSCVESGLSNLFDHLKNYGCYMYGNPWNCPLGTTIPKACEATCSICNNANTKGNCQACVTADQRCGYCDVGMNCILGNASGPIQGYYCQSGNWFYGKGSC